MVDLNPGPMNWCFSTLGCPELDLDGVIVLAKKFGFNQVELRALEGTVDLPAYFAAKYGSPAALATRLAGTGIRVASLDTSWKLIGAPAGACDAFLEYLEWAEALGGVPLRVFDGGTKADSASITEARDSIAWWEDRRICGNWKSSILVETHDAIVSTAAVRELFADAPASVGLLWDAHHTWKKGGEDPLVTWRDVKTWVRHIHVKDSIGEPSARHAFTYVSLGEGEFPLRPLLDTLSADGFRGVVSLEWERMWHPYLPSLEMAFQGARENGLL